MAGNEGERAPARQNTGLFVEGLILWAVVNKAHWLVPATACVVTFFVLNLLLRTSELLQENGPLYWVILLVGVVGVGTAVSIAVDIVCKAGPGQIVRRRAVAVSEV